MNSVWLLMPVVIMALAFAIYNFRYVACYPEGTDEIGDAIITVSKNSDGIVTAEQDFKTGEPRSRPYIHCGSSHVGVRPWLTHFEDIDKCLKFDVFCKNYCKLCKKSVNLTKY